ncbi:MAG: hypothetical protein HKN00_01270 [Flavobacteriaceae bacterium]|nr:hypothetical protein [Bacteroidia bacterium]MBT8287566.1 hypothetical protein [Bacteroidia bacterium]NNF73787.1 hypothetical protein [Flavobacteriaceae bacterium]NNK71677.1 hypothetical protein [Flavobacteriaceae bacterium]
MRFSNISSYSPILFFRRHRSLSISLSVILSLAIINLTFGCTYYKVQEVATSKETLGKEIDDFNKMGRYAIMHVGEQSWHLTKLVVNEDEQVLSGVALEIRPEHTYKKTRKSRGNRYQNKKQRPMDEIHFQLIPQTPVPEFGETVEIPFSRISSISINKKDGGTELATILLGTIGVLAGIFLIALALKSSCPFVYVKDGNTYSFAGELYPGVLTANMERPDYLQLHPKTQDPNELVVRITNELKEIQHTDLVKLLVVEKVNETEVLLDQKGNPMSFSSIQSPLKVIENGEFQKLEPALRKDKMAYAFNSLSDITANVKSLEFQFNRDDSAPDGKLYLTAKNSLWLDYTFGKFNKMFGTYYPTFQRNQQKSSAENSQTWMNEQHIPLSIYVETIDGWKLIERINPVGPLAYRNLAIPIELSNCPNGPINIKLETGFMFWEVDYIGIDYSKNDPAKVHYIEPKSAIDETGKDVTYLLKLQDGKYLTQPDIGNAVEVSFDLSHLDHSKIETYYLLNRGYYNYIRHYENEPEFDKLKVFKQAESFTEFSKWEYLVLMDLTGNTELASSYDN